MNTDRCQRWLEGRHTYRSAREVVDIKRLDVAELDERTAKAFVTRHHYSRRYPAARFRFGLYERGELAGVAVFSRPFTPEVITGAFPWLDDVDQGAELGRFVLLDHVGANAETWFLARCFAAVRERLRAAAGRRGRPHPRGRPAQRHAVRKVGVMPGAIVAWSVTDDECPEDVGSVLVYAETRERARYLGVAYLATDYVNARATRAKNADHLATSERVERDERVLRKLGWREEDSKVCAACLLTKVLDDATQQAIEQGSIAFVDTKEPT